jgi:hypothetical protein
MSRSRHPDKHIEKAVAYAEARGWTLRKQGHWGACIARMPIATAVRSA